MEHKLVSNLENDHYYSGDEIQLKLQKAILTLPEKQRLVFNMKYFEEMKYKDMSTILDVSVGGLKAQYHHAVKNDQMPTSFVSAIELTISAHELLMLLKLTITPP